MMPGIMGIAGFAGGASKEASYLSYVEDDTTASAYTFSSYAIGAAAADRRIFGIIHWLEGGAHRTLDTVTIGGVSATIHKQIGHSGGSTGLGVAIVSAIVPTGTTANVVINVFGGATWDSCSFSAIGTTGMTRSTPFDSDTAENQNTTGNLNSSTNIDTDGLIICAMTGSTGAYNDFVSWTGATEQYDMATSSTPNKTHVSLAWQSGLAAETGRSITAAVSATINSGNDLAVVSWS